jgi:hypothetical protein
MKPIEKEFGQGVKILLERMENNPEDFVGSDDPEKMYETPKFSVFTDLMRDIVRGDKVKHWDDWHLLTKEEQSALIQGYKNMMRSRFDRGIMQKLLEEPKEKETIYYPPTTKNGPLTINQITNESLKILEQELDRGMLRPKKFLLNPSQIAVAQKMGISPADYAKKINAPKV